MIRTPFAAILAIVLAIGLAACGTQTVRVEPVKVEPIHMTIDINLHDTPGGTVTRP